MVKKTTVWQHVREVRVVPVNKELESASPNATVKKDIDTQTLENRCLDFQRKCTKRPSRPTSFSPRSPWHGVPGEEACYPH